MSSTQPESEDTEKVTCKIGEKTYEWFLGKEKVNEVKLPGGKKFNEEDHLRDKLLTAHLFNKHYEKTFEQSIKLGEGSFGSVWKARHLYDESFYAVKKIILSKFENLNLVINEAKALAKLEHPNVVRYFSSWIQSSNSDWTDLTPTELTIFIQMELCSTSLRRYLKERDNQIDSHFKIKIFHGILKGIEYVHGKNLIHRDIRTDNIFLQEINNEYVPKIGDFGLVKSGKPTHLEANTKETDIYELGLVLRDLYFPGKGLDYLENIVTQQDSFNNTVIKLILQMTDDPSKRPQATTILTSNMFNMSTDIHFDSLEEKIKSLEQENATLKEYKVKTKGKVKSLEEKIKSLEQENATLKEYKVKTKVKVKSLEQEIKQEKAP